MLRSPLVRMILLLNDYNDANGNGFSGYEVESGDYEFTLGKNAHDAYDSVKTTLENSIQIAEDTTTGYTVENRFDDVDDQLNETQMLSRADWEGTMPKMRTSEEKAANVEFIESLSSRDSKNPLTTDSDMVKEAEKNRPAATVKKAGELQLYELIGAEADDSRWDTLVSQMTVNEIFDIVKDCAFKSPGDEFIGKPITIDLDGPSGFTNSTVRRTSDVYDTCFYCCESVLGATWNKDLAKRMGESIGNEGLIGDEKGTGVTYNGLYGPGTNIHRTPFGGRNPEYYSEDPVLSGEMAANMVSGAASKGVYCFIKHFAVNDQETHRNGVCVWLTEQSMRELYLKPFEIAVKDGKATAIMSSFNRIGSTWTGGSYNLITEVLRNEWGFDGAVITDFASGQSQMDLQQMVYAGGDMWLDTVSPSKWYEKADALDTYQLQESAKHILYMVANSNAMNGLSDGVEIETKPAYWRLTLQYTNIGIPVILLLWAALYALRNPKPKKNN